MTSFLETLKIDEYSIKARIFPALILAIPFLVLFTFFLQEKLNNVWVVIIGDTVFMSAIVYLLSQLIRVLGKELEKIHFKNKLYMPTTEFLLFENSKFSDEHKKRIRDLIQKDFGIRLPSKQKENNNKEDTRKQIDEAVGFIRNRVGKGRLLLQHNIEYGFWRNLIGGSIIGLLGCLFLGTYSYWYNLDFLYYFVFVLFLLCLFPIVFRKYLMDRMGELYAERLFEEYVSLPRD